MRWVLSRGAKRGFYLYSNKVFQQYSRTSRFVFSLPNDSVVKKKHSSKSSTFAAGGKQFSLNPVFDISFSVSLFGIPSRKGAFRNAKGLSLTFVGGLNKTIELLFSTAFSSLIFLFS